MADSYPARQGHIFNTHEREIKAASRRQPKKMPDTHTLPSPLRRSTDGVFTAFFQEMPHCQSLTSFRKKKGVKELNHISKFLLKTNTCI